MSQTALSKPPSPLQLRDELETMVLKELLGPGSAEEEVIESPGIRYFVGVLASLDLVHGFHETKQGVRYTISEPARREVLARLLKLNHERYAEEVKQGLHEKKKGATKKAALKQEASKPLKLEATLFDGQEDDE